VQVQNTQREIDMMTREELERESTLSDEDILDVVLDAEQQMAEALEDTINGLLNPLIIKGPPGVGKTEAVKIATRQAGVRSTDLLGSVWTKHSEDDIKAGMSAYPYRCDHLTKVDGALIRGADYSKWALAADLYGNKDEGVLCLDDNDSILKDKDAVSMIMSATEQSAERTVKYVKANSTHDLQMMGVEPTFKVRTPIIILTNLDMKGMIDQANLNKKKIPADYIPRWSALVSRGTYIDLHMNSPRSIRVFCEHKIKQVKMLTESAWLEEKFGRSLSDVEAKECMKWVRANQVKLADPLDLRTYNKVASIMINRKASWEKSAQVRFLKSA
jgi:hypothetical protein